MNAKSWLERAKKEKFAIGAFNVGNLETLRAVGLAAKNKNAPVIIEASKGEVNFLDPHNLVSMVADLRKELGIEVILNLDHSPTFDDAKVGVEAGFDYIHLDGSSLPYEENVRQTKMIVELAHSKGLLVEGEMDKIPGGSSIHSGTVEAGVKTDPAKAAEFVKETGIDTFASFIGNAHGLYSNQKNLDLDLLKRIREVLPDTYLSLHGGSGISDIQVKSAVELGINKINVNTEIRQLFRQELEGELKENPDEVTMYKIMPEVIEKIRELVESKIELFGAADKADHNF